MTVVTAGSGWAPSAGETNLYLAAAPIHSGLVPLYMERPTTNVAPLYIKSFLSSGNVPLYSSGVFHSSGNMTLFYPSPQITSTTELFTKGYRE